VEEAHAQMTIRQPGRHPTYDVDLEPHVALSLLDPPGPWANGGWGGGFYATVPLTDNGFVKTINNSVGLRFGADILWHSNPAIYGDPWYSGYCRQWRPAPNGTRVCVDTGAYDEGGPTTYLLFPVAMQWNFWLSDRWSVFGEPGLAIYTHPWGPHWGDRFGVLPNFQAGGRVMLGERTALTMRLGYPTLSLGLSFLP
jgi:hypothetical protein